MAPIRVVRSREWIATNAARERDILLRPARPTGGPRPIRPVRPIYRAIPDDTFGTVYRTSDGSTFEHEWQAAIHADPASEAVAGGTAR